jgi:DNA (cytosine-5)-methyltransferase 1
LPIVWPEPTHGHRDSLEVSVGAQKPYRTAADIIDWSIPCPSIFMDPVEAKKLGLKRPLAEATLRRIARGVMRYVVNNPKPFIVTLNHSGENQRAWQMDEPFRTVTASRDAHALVTPVVTRAQHGGANRDPEDPMHTICASTKDQNAIIAPVLTKFRKDNQGASIEDPMPTVTANGHNKRAGCGIPLGVVTAFLAQHNTGVTGHEAEVPLSTIVGKGCTQSVVAAHMINMKGSDRRDSAADDPAATITAGGNHAFTVATFLTKYYGNDGDSRTDEPLHTVSTKDRFGLVTVTIDGEEYVIVDIGMRMLTPRELYLAQGFPPEYIIDTRPDGSPITKTAQTRMCGNSVCPPLAEALVRANFPEAAEMERAA